MKMKSVSHHARIRIGERGSGNINYKNKSLAVQARKGEYDFKTYEKYMGSTKLVQYFKHKIRKYTNCKYSIYLNYFFVFGRDGYLITTYPIPEKFHGEVAKYPVIKELQKMHISYSFKKFEYQKSYEILFKLNEDSYKNMKFYFEKEEDAKKYAIKLGLTNPMVKKYVKQTIKETSSDEEALKKCLDNKYIIIKEIIKENANELLSTT